jgi:cobalt/nickel transport system permease protein
MHIPDGFLSPPVWLACDALAASAIGWVARRAPRGAPAAPLPGVMGAFVFAAQMINVPVAPGVSGHLLGGALLALVLGPSAAMLTMTAILILQAFLFQDGGVLALGANVCNMALAGVVMGYLPVRIWGRRPFTIFAGAVLSVLVSGALAVAQLRASGAVWERGVLLAAVGLFLAGGLLEGVITVAAVRSIERLAPRAIPDLRPAPARVRLAVSVTALLLVTVGAWFASEAPDSLDHLTTLVGLREQRVWRWAPLPGYEWSGLGPGWLQQSAAGLVGLASIYAICALSARRR